jgi:7-cyano-7-deazaguanine synthase
MPKPVVKSIVLLSGGLDSVTNLYRAKQESKVVLALTFNYGQRAAKKEEAAAQYFCRLNNVNHKSIDLKWFSEIGKSSLIDRKYDVPTGEQVKIDDLKTSIETAKSVWVPNRNGIFLNIAAGFAESLGADLVVPGFNAEEAKTFPDNSENFLKAVSGSFEYSTANKVKAISYTIDLEKPAIVAIAKSLQIPLEKIWPCYFDGPKWCGECESCLRFKRALKSQGFDRLSDF